MIGTTLENIQGQELKAFLQKLDTTILPSAFYDFYVSPANGERNIALDAASATNKKKGVDISAWIGCAKGNFGSVREIDSYIHRERESWD